MLTGCENKNGDNEEQLDALQLAVKLGDAEMCRILICEGKMNALDQL
jgi:hypothetical protein